MSIGELTEISRFSETFEYVRVLKRTRGTGSYFHSFEPPLCPAATSAVYVPRSERADPWSEADLRIPYRERGWAFGIYFISWIYS